MTDQAKTCENCELSPNCDLKRTGHICQYWQLSRGSGLKFDAGKPLMSLLPVGTLEKVAEVLTFGAKKYSANSWQNVDNAETRYLDALMRHLEAHRRGEERDPDSGLTHLQHLTCNALFLLWFQGRT